ncbi:Amino acid ABC transporter substrate-binding protein (PAAT family) [Vibrio crassostreae]|uniref:hypothetical protein n=1 Tax=Vibrio crassostreae TaxID=246167 RepID=UPI000F470C56|nr:hypothetical protein [Vibrio crassostreae]ROP23165.1 hypothetical protein EDB33_103270 [Vibrio crassostreae]ROP23803.1 hypothetical protein EDB34_103270 [Vibrio crassostreae]ROQ88022.1 hypothetical protein EDB72_1577 [Vibrio crassostreae]RPE98614.1 hypothetical protein EDB15_10397 [Vibrio crassostreae]RPF06295.1 hypothetical protein EDB17_0757 [Vibrio crassostreae]
MKTTLGTFLAIFSFLFSAILFSTHAHAAAYGVSVAWKTDDAQAVFEAMPHQKKAFANLIDAGLVHDMFVSQSFIGDKKFPMIKFVIEADSEQHVRDLIGNLPFQFKELVEVTEIRDIGNKWLNTDVAFTNYAVELAWKEPENQFIVDEVISKDLQMVVDWSAQGVMTSAYLKHQEIAEEKPNQKAMIRPVYSMAILAKNEEQAREIANQLNAVKLGFAEVMVSELGFKLEL